MRNRNRTSRTGVAAKKIFNGCIVETYMTVFNVRLNSQMQNHAVDDDQAVIFHSPARPLAICRGKTDRRQTEKSAKTNMIAAQGCQYGGTCTVLPDGQLTKGNRAQSLRNTGRQ